MFTESLKKKHGTEKPVSMLIGLAVSLLLHGIGLWYVMHHDALVTKSPGDQTDNRITVSVLPSAPSVPSMPPTQAQPPNLAQAAPAAPRKKPSPAPAVKKQNKKPVPATENQIAKAAESARSKPLARTERDNPSLQEDFSSQLEAARRRRMNAADDFGLPEPTAEAPTQEAAKNDNSIAMANIEFSLKQGGKGQDDVGGVFKLKKVAYQDAEFLFYGWSERSRRHATRLITVEKGTNPDIQTAVVKKVIDIIREEKNGDFFWDSNRLGKPISLSARPQHTKELEQFLLREFFPDYNSALLKG